MPPPAPAAAGSGRWPRPLPSQEDEQEQPSWRVSGSGREREQYALRRSQFVRSYRLISPATPGGRGDVGEGLIRVWVRKARVAGRGAAARARGAVVWWLGRASTGLLGCFVGASSSAASRKYYYLQRGFA